MVGKKHRFDDTEYLEKTEELKEGVKNAVSMALLKKRKKAKLVHNSHVGEEKGQGNLKDHDAVVEENASVTLAAEQPIALDAVGA